MFLITLAVKATAIVVVAWLLSVLLRRSSAAARQLVWTISLVAILLLPVVSITAPPVQPRISRPLTVIAVSAEITQAANPSPAIPTIQWSRIISGAYLIGVACVLAPLLFGSARTAKIARESRIFKGSTESPVPVLITDRLTLPVTWGLFRPVILLPEAAQQWPSDRLRLVIAHEAAHIRRWDYPGQVAAQLACAVYWFHPLTWWAFRQLIKEREQACDDEVLNMGIKGTVYADHLLNIIRSARQENALFSPAVGMAQESTFEHRLKAMLNPGLNRRAPSRRLCAGSAVLAALVLLPLAALRLPSQTTTASIQGTIHDPTAAVIPFARILLTNNNGKNVETVTSRANGSFSLSGIQPGRYAIEVRAPGFEPFRQGPVELTAGSSLNLDATINVGAMNESVEVLGKKPANAPSTDAQVPQRIRVGGMVQASKLLEKVQPVYPESALRKGLEGTVLLRAVIGTDGRLLSLGAVSSASDPGLTQAALDAVRLWTYEPTLLNGEPVEVATTIAVTFRLQ